MTTDQILLGVGLTVVLAVGSQVIASRMRIPAIILLLPAGFVAGAVTDDVDPNRLLGPAFPPLVSLAVAVILYDAGLSLDLSKLAGHTRRVVVRLIGLGVVVTTVAAAGTGLLLLGMSWRAALMLGAILIVSGPTVVAPLLNFVRPGARLQRILMWEGSLIDPVGAVLGALVFHAVTSSTRRHTGDQLTQFGASVAVGFAGGAIGALLLWFLLHTLRLDEALGTTAQLAAVIAIAALCDVLRDDSGLIAAVIMGLAVGNGRGFDVPARRPFFETLVQLVVGLLFISISATVTPASLHHLVLPSLALVSVLVVVARPIVALLAGIRTDLPIGERLFVGWMAPRGIVAAATASTFSVGLVNRGIAGADKILPATFVVIVGTVALYGLSSVSVARLLGVTRPARTRPLLVGDDPWTVELGQVLRSAGLDVLMWAGEHEQRNRIRNAGLELAPGELLAAATGAGAQLEGITAVLLLTRDDDFNALAATVLRPNVEGAVYRLRPASDDTGVVAPFTAGQTLFRPGLTRNELAMRFARGAQLLLHTASDPTPSAHDVLFLIDGEGRLVPVADDEAPASDAPDSAADETRVVLQDLVPRPRLVAGQKPAGEVTNPRPVDP